MYAFAVTTAASALVVASAAAVDAAAEVTFVIAVLSSASVAIAFCISTKVSNAAPAPLVTSEIASDFAVLAFAVASAAAAFVTTTSAAIYASVTTTSAAINASVTTTSAAAKSTPVDTLSAVILVAFTIVAASFNASAIPARVISAVKLLVNNNSAARAVVASVTISTACIAS